MADEQFKAELGGHVQKYAASNAFRVGKSELDALGWDSGKILSIGRINFQVVADGECWYLFKIAGKRLHKKYSVSGNTFLVGKKKKLPIMDLVGWKPEVVRPVAEEIKVEKAEDLPVVKPVFEEDGHDVKGTWFSENFYKYTKEDVSGDVHETPMDVISQYGSYKDLPDEGSNSHFWFTLAQDFRDSKEFWEELRSYYKVNSDELAKKLAPLEVGGESPVFSKRIHAHLDLVELNTSLVQRIGERVESLLKDKDSIRQQLLDLQDSLLRQGIQPGDSKDYSDLYIHQKEIADCIEQAKETLERYSHKIQSLDKEAGKTLNRSVVEIHGSPELISKHYEKVTGRLIDLNLEISALRQRQQELEHELIRRLKDVEDAKEIRSRLIQLEKEQVLADFREENEEGLKRRDRAEFFEELGALSENTAFIQRKIEDEKQKINYYMDNLKSLSAYDNYETTTFEHFKKKQKAKRDAQDLKREIYKIKLFLERKEKKYDEFFGNIEGEMGELRGDVSRACLDNIQLRDRCVRVWEDRWSSEGTPLMREMLDRTSRIVSAFAPIPATQIVKIEKLKEKLISEIADRQKEWERVFNEIKREFKDMKYELATPMNSELDQKYLNRMDDATLTLSKDTQNIIFIPEAHFKLSNATDDRIGLEPRTQNDSDFLVIDQVWETLTPEQEKELERKLAGESKDDGTIEAREHVLREQLQRIQNRFPVQKESMELSQREMTEGEKREKYREIESNELQLWRGDNYLIANSRGEFKEALYEITKKLFSVRSVRVVERDMEFTNTGLVRDGNTEIMSSKDYFIKPEDRTPFEGASDDLDLSEIANIHVEPDKEMIELLADPSYVAHAKERDDKLAKLSAPLKPSVVEWAQIHLKKYHEEKGKIYDVETIRGKLLEMEDEVKALKKYHETKGEQLEQALVDRDSSFNDLRSEIDKTKEFLEGRKQGLRDILKDVDQALEEKIRENQSEMIKVHSSSAKNKKQGFIYWMNRLWHGWKDGDDDFTTV